jgi:hypothetical protein
MCAHIHTYLCTSQHTNGRVMMMWNAEEETGTECLPTVESLAADEVEAADEADADSFALMD